MAPAEVSYETLPVEYAGELMPVTPAEINWSGDFKEIAAQQGFDDLDFTAYGIWPIVSLDRGDFKVSTGGSLGREFYAQIQQKRKKFLFSNGVPYGQKGAEAVYSYDGVTASGSGKPLSELTAGWAKTEKREYLELVCRLKDSRIILLSVPPQSVSRFVTFVADTITSRVLVANAWCRVHIGPRVEKAAVPFDPIGFELVR
ncbi:MAG: hypothetical protein EOM24_20230 [Chloroflexia bacterium]|nr:hypothetical protein [Chloroflexia bacterium]